MASEPERAVLEVISHSTGVSAAGMLSLVQSIRRVVPLRADVIAMEIERWPRARVRAAAAALSQDET